MYAISTVLIWLVAAQTAPPLAADTPTSPPIDFRQAPADSRLSLPNDAMPIPAEPPTVTGVEQTAAQQGSGGRSLSGGVPAAAASTAPSSNPATASSRPLPPELIAQAVQLPSEGPIQGQKLTLLEALSTTMDRRRQAEITHAYWRLSEAIAEYHYSAEESAAIQQLAAHPQDAAMLDTAKASAAAALQAAQRDVVEAQAHLAEAAMLSPGRPLPLPADLPHVGPYRTQFEQLFAGRMAPPRTRLIDRTLPIARQAIEVRATAVSAAEDALEATKEAYQRGPLEFSAVLSAMGQLGSQRRALVAAVCQYNHDIADYVLAVANPGTHGAALVSMLIRTAKPSATAPTGSADLLPIPDYSNGPSEPVQAASFQEPVSSYPYAAPYTVPRSGQPTLAPQGQLPLPPPPQDPSLPSAAPQPHLAPTRAPTPVPASAASSQDTTQETFVPMSQAEEQPAALVAGETTGTPRSVRRVASDPAAGQPTEALYPALASLAADFRTKELSDHLHRDPAAPEERSQSISLEEGLRMARTSSDRGPVIHAYWEARQKASQYRALQQTADLLVQLEQVVLERRQDPLGPLGMLRVRADRLATEAKAAELRTSLLASQFELTERLGRPLQGSWLYPSTPPHAGPYDLNLKAQAPALLQRWSTQRLASTIPTLTASLQARATAVICADNARARAWAGYQSGTQSLNSLLTCLRQQSDQTQAFLELGTEYNDAIAEYVLAIVPPNAPANLLSQTLVLR